MRIFFQRNRKLGLTLDEVIVVLGVIGFIAAMWIFAKSRRHPSTGIACINNLKHVGLGFRFYANDHNGKFPDYHITNEAWSYFQTAGTEISTPKVLICPNDSDRAEKKKFPLDFGNPPTTNSFANPNFRNKNLSYFYGVDADETKPDILLAGDRNLSTNNKILTGWLILTTNNPITWTKEIHKSEGNIVVADGSVQKMTSGRLREHLRLSTNETQRLLLP